MKKKIIIICIIVLVLLGIGLYLYNKDNIRFKFSYEYLNNVEYNNGKTIKVSIPINNNIKYIGNKELIKLLDSGTGVIYFGYNSCPWCRNIVPILIDTVKSNNIKTIYYVDIHKVDVSKEVYKKLESYLRENDEKEKVLAVPDVYVVKDGEILDHHIGTVSSYKNPYSGMTDSEKQELRNIYNEMMKELK